jgi:ADP-ribose pyrophosphatase YjhB (NUDIX family)
MKNAINTASRTPISVAESRRIRHLPMMPSSSAYMVTDPALQHFVTTRILAAKLGDTPSEAVHDLGNMRIRRGGQVRVYARHAADAIILDDFGQVVLITRRHNPGAGKLALPGGFLDEIDGVVEAPAAAARREAIEETGIDPALLTTPTPIGRRAYDRPFDIRAAWNDPPGTKIKQGEWFGVSTQGFCFRVPGDLTRIPLKAGDDAKDAGIYLIARLRSADFAVPDHLPMIRAAFLGARLSPATI